MTRVNACSPGRLSISASSSLCVLVSHQIGFWISYKYVELVYHGPRLAFGKSDLLSGKARQDPISILST